MRTPRLMLALALSALAACSQGLSTTKATAKPFAAAVSPDMPSQQTIQWGPAPAVFPPGAEFAVLEGDPTKAEPFTVRLRLPDGYKIPPHTHPTAENVTVLSGTFLAGMGARFVDSDLHPYGRNDFASIPAGHAHFAMARGVTIVQVHAIGPFALTYVNPDGSIAR
jgi:quercetin dioxygenase-like cupin family protein